MAKYRSTKFSFQDFEKNQALLSKENLPFIFIYGTSDSLLEISIESIRQKYASEAVDVTTIEGSALSESLIESLLNQPSLLGFKSFYLVRRAEQAKNLHKSLKRFKSLPLRRAILALVWGGKEPPKTLLEEMKRLGAFLAPCHDPWPSDLPSVIQFFAKRLGTKLDTDAIDALIEANGQDLIKHQHEINKIALIYPGYRDPLTKNDIAPLLGLLRQDDAFLLDRILQQRNWDEANALISSLIARGHHGLSLVAIIANHCRHIIKIRSALNEGCPSSQLEKKLGIPYFILKAYLPAAQKAKIDNYIQALQFCQEADMALKSTRISESLLVAKIVETLAQSI